MYEHFSVGVTIGFVQTAFNISENQSYVELCVGISGIPEDGLECDVEASIALNGLPKAGRFEIHGQSLL